MVTEWRLATRSQLLSPPCHKQTCSILSQAHISAPACCLPPSQWTGRHLLLAQCRPLREQMFSCCWVTGQDRRWISREPGKGTLRPAAPTPLPICLPWLAEISLIRAIRGGVFFLVRLWSRLFVSFFLQVSLKAILAIYLFRPRFLLSLCSMPGNLLSARNIDLNTSIPDLEKVTVRRVEKIHQ